MPGIVGRELLQRFRLLFLTSKGTCSGKGLEKSSLFSKGAVSNLA